MRRWWCGYTAEGAKTIELTIHLSTEDLLFSIFFLFNLYLSLVYIKVGAEAGLHVRFRVIVL